MSNLHAFFIQFQVNNISASLNHPVIPRGIATIIVFADSQHTARCRAGRIIADRRLEITDFLRIHLIRKSYIEILDTVLQKLYVQAELYGIAIHCDLFPTDTSCCNAERNQPD